MNSERLYHLFEGFDFGGDVDVDEEDGYCSVEVAQNAVIKEALKDMDISWALTAVTGVVPPKGWKVRQEADFQVLALDGKWTKWQQEMRDKLIAAGWHDIGSGYISWQTLQELEATNYKGPYSKETQEDLDKHQQLLEEVPAAAEAYLHCDSNNPNCWLKTWWNLFISPDGGMFCVFPGGWEEQSVLGPTGTKYYIPGDSKYDVKAEREQEKQLRKARQFLNGRLKQSIARYISRDEFAFGFDSEGYPVYRLLANEQDEQKYLSRAAKRRGMVGYTHNRMNQYGLEHMCCRDITRSSDPLKPCFLYIGGYTERYSKDGGDVYAAVYMESQCPEVFKRCREVCANNGKKFVCNNGRDCTAIYEYGLTQSGVDQYKKSVLNGKGKK